MHDNGGGNNVRDAGNVFWVQTHNAGTWHDFGAALAGVEVLGPAVKELHDLAVDARARFGAAPWDAHIGVDTNDGARALYKIVAPAFNKVL